MNNMLKRFAKAATIAYTATETVSLGQVDAALSLIPLPVEVRRNEGEFVLDEKTQIVAPRELYNEADLLAESLRRATSFRIPVVLPSPGEPSSGSILLRLRENPKVHAEGSYQLTITPSLIIIEAGTLSGHFYGTRTLLQLLPPQATTGKRPKTRSTIRWTAPCVEIFDRPRFSWRGFMLDDANNFQGVATVKKYLDEMAALKMNVFHWHLIDNQGWRLEIKRYPRLTSVGADSPGEGKGDIATHNSPSQLPRYYYTQQEAKEIIDYAARRHIRVVPEIEMPGHANAALRAYPEWSAGGIFDTTNPMVIEALKNILDEVMELFPDAVIHTGGDEVMYWVWEAAPSIKAAMKAKGLKSSAPLQLEFSNMIAVYLAGKRRRMMYWADSLEQIPNETSAILQYWQGDQKVITNAANQGFDIVNSERFYTYLDYDYGLLPLEKAYRFDPIPPDLDEKSQARILGTGYQAWSIYMPTPSRSDHQVFPRLAAGAEVAWTLKENKDYAGFTRRLKGQEQRWNMAEIHYARGRDIPNDQLWKEVIKGQKIGSWSPDQVKIGSIWNNNAAINDHELDITRFIAEAGRYYVAFTHTRGIDTLSVRRVEILEDGKPIAADWGGHMLISIEPGEPDGDIHLFDLAVHAVKPGSRYTLKANYFGLKGTDSSGDIFIKNVGDLQPIYIEEPDHELP